MSSIQPRKQRREMFNAPIHVKRKRISSHLAENLLLKYDRRNLPVIKGDTVKVMRGSFKGHEDKVSDVFVKDGHIVVEGVTMIKTDGKKIAKPLHPSNVLITKLNLTDKWRRDKLERGLPEEAKKGIEKEAEEQLKQLEEQKKEEEKITAAKELEKPEEKPGETTEEKEEAPIETKTTESEKEEEQPPATLEEKKEPSAVEHPTKTTKKEPTKKKTVKKISTKTTTKKKEAKL